MALNIGWRQRNAGNPENDNLLDIDNDGISFYPNPDGYLELKDVNLHVITSDAQVLSSIWSIQERYGNYDGDTGSAGGIPINAPTLIAVGKFADYKWEAITGFNGNVYGTFENYRASGDFSANNQLTGHYVEASNRNSSDMGYITGGYYTAHAESTASVEIVGLTGAALKGNLNGTPILVGIRGITAGHMNGTEICIAGDFVTWKGVSAGETVDLQIGVRARPNCQLGFVNEFQGLSLTSWVDSVGGIALSYGIYADTSIDVGTTNSYFIYSLSVSPSIFSGDIDAPKITVDEDTFDSGWNGNNEVPTKNDTYDEFARHNASFITADFTVPSELSFSPAGLSVSVKTGEDIIIRGLVKFNQGTLLTDVIEFSFTQGGLTGSNFTIQKGIVNIYTSAGVLNDTIIITDLDDTFSEGVNAGYFTFELILTNASTNGNIGLGAKLTVGTGDNVVEAGSYMTIDRVY